MSETEGVFSELPHKSLRSAALAAIREAILCGQLRPGQHLVESDLADQMGISRAPIREALRQLETEGLVVSLPHRGTFVTQLSAQDVWEIYTLRAAIEGLASRLVAQNATEEEIVCLEESVAQMERSAEAGDLELLAQQDLDFHEYLCRAAHHNRLLDTWLSMNAQIRTMIDFTSRLYLPADEIVRCHAEVVDAICQGQADRAARAITGHINGVGELIWREMDMSSELVPDEKSPAKDDSTAEK
ncbi:MAG: GntR family transcriptional regulator [Chloroflexota bacterium]|nr:GntR family transcriptional regulator [Chloroflexota bacterium]